MQILGIVGSMRKNRHTNTLVNQVISDMKLIDSDVVANVIYTADKTIHPCRVVCSNYCSNNPYPCSISVDVVEILQMMIKTDALIIGAPLYFRAPPAKFQAFIERLISIFFFFETQGKEIEESPLKGKPCGLIGVAEYSNPHQILEYLFDFCTVLKMKPVVLGKFPYMGVAGQGDVNEDAVFNPFERSKDLADALVKEVQRRDNQEKL
jgi:multimeric flavodoxin WrbA